MSPSITVEPKVTGRTAINAACARPCSAPGEPASGQRRQSGSRSGEESR